MSSDKFYILDRHTEENIDINSTKKLIIKISNYFNFISSIKWFLISLSSTITIVIIGEIINAIHISEIILFDIGKWSAFDAINYILNVTVYNILIYIFPLNILKFISKGKSIKLHHILLIVSIILAIFTEKGYLNSGILIYSVSVSLEFIYNFIYYYTYGLFYYKRKKPLIILSTISIIENIIIILGTIVLSKI